MIIPGNRASTKLVKNLSISWDNEKEAARHSLQSNILYPWVLETVVLVPRERLAGKSWDAKAARFHWHISLSKWGFGLRTAQHSADKSLWNPAHCYSSRQCYGQWLSLQLLQYKNKIKTSGSAWQEACPNEKVMKVHQWGKKSPMCWFQNCFLGLICTVIPVHCVLF